MYQRTSRQLSYFISSKFKRGCAFCRTQKCHQSTLSRKRHCYRYYRLSRPLTTTRSSALAPSQTWNPVSAAQPVACHRELWPEIHRGQEGGKRSPFQRGWREVEGCGRLSGHFYHVKYFSHCSLLRKGIKKQVGQMYQVISEEDSWPLYNSGDRGHPPLAQLKICVNHLTPTKLTAYCEPEALSINITTQFIHILYVL